MKDQPLRVVQPVVVPGQFFSWGMIFSLFVAIFPAGFVGVVTMAATDGRGPGFLAGLFVYVLVFVLLMGLIGWGMFNGPRVTFYRIYRDRIEIEEGVLNRTQRTVMTSGIVEVRLSESMLQRPQGAGTITLLLQPLAVQGQTPLAYHTISLANVPEARGLYDLVRSLALDKHRVLEPGPEPADAWQP